MASGLTPLSRYMVVCPLLAEAALVPEWGARVIGPSASCIDNLNRLDLPRDGALLLIGLAGGLIPKACLGSVFQIESVKDSQGRTIRPTARTSDFGIAGTIQQAVIACVDQVVATPAEKADLAVRTSASLVDMESAHLARWCDGHGWRWCMVRAVLDGPNDSLPEGIHDWCRSDGKVNPWAVLWAILRNPRTLTVLPLLAKSRGIAGKALRNALGHPLPSRMASPDK